MRDIIPTPRAGFGCPHTVVPVTAFRLSRKQISRSVSSSGVTFPWGLTNLVDLSPVFFDGAHADSRDGDKVCSFGGAPLSDGSQRLVTEDAERRYTPPPRFLQSPATQRLFDG